MGGVQDPLVPESGPGPEGRRLPTGQPANARAATAAPSSASRRRRFPGRPRRCRRVRGLGRGRLAAPRGSAPDHASPAAAALQTCSQDSGGVGDCFRPLPHLRQPVGGVGIGGVDLDDTFQGELGVLPALLARGRPGADVQRRQLQTAVARSWSCSATTGSSGKRVSTSASNRTTSCHRPALTLGQRCGVGRIVGQTASSLGPDGDTVAGAATTSKTRPSGARGRAPEWPTRRRSRRCRWTSVPVPSRRPPDSRRLWPRTSGCENAMAASSVISNCIAMTAGTPCLPRVWAVPAYGSCRLPRAPSHEFSTAIRSVRWSWSSMPRWLARTSWNRPSASSKATRPSSASTSNPP